MTLVIVLLNLVGMLCAYGFLCLAHWLKPLKHGEEPWLWLPMLFWPVTCFLGLFFLVFFGLVCVFLTLDSKLKDGLKAMERSRQK